MEWVAESTAAKTQFQSILSASAGHARLSSDLPRVVGMNGNLNESPRDRFSTLLYALEAALKVRERRVVVASSICLPSRSVQTSPDKHESILAPMLLPKSFCVALQLRRGKIRSEQLVTDVREDLNILGRFVEPPPFNVGRSSSVWSMFAIAELVMAS